MNRPFASPKINWIIAESNNPHYLCSNTMKLNRLLERCAIVLY